METIDEGANSAIGDETPRQELGGYDRGRGVMVGVLLIGA